VAQVSSPVETPGSTGFQPVGTPSPMSAVCGFAKAAGYFPQQPPLAKKKMSTAASNNNIQSIDPILFPLTQNGGK